MPRGGSPEEFFEVFRQVQTGKKAQDEPVQQRAQAESPQPPVGPGLRARLRGVLVGPPLSLSRLAALIGGVAVVLVAVAAYQIGWQRGWYASATAQRPADDQGAQTTPRRAPAGEGERPQAELVDGKVFTLVTLGSSPRDLDRVRREVEYLNSYAPFQALGVRAYVYQDRKGKYRVCARGLAAMNTTEREQVRERVRRLKSLRGHREYETAGLYPP